MRIAWFCPASTDGPLSEGETAPLIAHLRETHAVHLFRDASAHEFVWRHARQKFDVCVYELADTRDYDFVWAYVFQYPGILHLRSTSLGDSRTAALLHHQRAPDHAAEVSFGGAEMVRAPAAASILLVVSDEQIAGTLQDRYSDARVRSVPLASAGADQHPVEPDRDPHAPLRVGVVDGALTPLIERAVDRARAVAVQVDLVSGGSISSVVTNADVVVSVPWPPRTELGSGALAAMAAARAVIILETEATAGVPALNPQTWVARDLSATEPPVVVSLDPRDEEHSLLLALRRLAGNVMLRRELGAAAASWWRAHAAPAAAAQAWLTILDEAAALSPPERPPSWPAHLSPDGTEEARGILGEFGIESAIGDW